MGRRRKNEGSKRRFKRRLREFLFQALNDLMDRVMGPEEQKASKKRKTSHTAGAHAPPTAARDAEPSGDEEQA
jgi:hypothetical protein